MGNGLSVTIREVEGLGKLLGMGAEIISGLERID